MNNSIKKEEEGGTYKSVYNALCLSKIKPPSPEDMAGKLMSVQDYLDNIDLKNIDYTNPGPQQDMQYMPSICKENSLQDKEKK